MKTKIPKIQATTDYSQFKLFNSNRDINASHLKRLKASITIKNLLYLFPIVVNTDHEIVDGQHRLRAAKDLQLPIFFIVDDSVTKADIAMVNNNRKGWSSKDYINFYVKEGYSAYRKLQILLTTYPLTIIGAVRLMREKIVYGQGGGTDSGSVKGGTITDEDYKTAKTVCEILEPLHKHVPYIYRPDLVMDFKSVYVKHSLKKEYCIERLLAGKHLFPKESFYYDPQTARILKEILIPENKGHSVEEVAEIFNKLNMKL